MPLDYDVFAQTGTSTVDPGCPHAAFISYAELMERIATADIVITHAGNTVRLVQRAGGVPIAIARESMIAVRWATTIRSPISRQEEQHGRVIAVWDVESLDDVVAKHQIESERLLAERRLGCSSRHPSRWPICSTRPWLGSSADTTAATRRPTPGWDDALHRIRVLDAHLGPTRSRDTRYDAMTSRGGTRPASRAGTSTWALASGTSPVRSPRAAGRPVSAADASPAYVAEIGRRFPAPGRLRDHTGGPNVPYADATFTLGEHARRTRAHR